MNRWKKLVKRITGYMKVGVDWWTGVSLLDGLLLVGGLSDGLVDRKRMFMWSRIVYSTEVFLWRLVEICQSSSVQLDSCPALKDLVCQYHTLIARPASTQLM